MKKMIKKITSLTVACAMIFTMLVSVNVMAAGYDLCISDNFDDCTLESLYSNGWRKGGWWWSPDSKIVSDGGNQYLKFEQNACITYDLDAPINSGKVRIKASMMFEEGTRGAIELIPERTFLNADDEQEELGLYAVCSRGGSKVFGTQTESASVELVSNYTPNVWYDFSIVVDFDKGVYNVSASRDGDVIKQVRNLKPGISGNANAYGLLTELSKIRFRNIRQSSSLYVDNFSAEWIEGEDTQDLVLRSESFENITTDNMQGLGILAMSPTLSFEVPEGIADSKTAVMTNVNSGIRIAMPYALTKGRYNLSYDVYLSGNPYMIELLPTADTGDGLNMAYIDENGNIYHTTYVKDGSCLFASADNGQWITINNIVDLDKKTVTHSVYDASGNQIGGTVTAKGFRNIVGSGYVDQSLTYFRIRNWSSAYPANYLDNFKLSVYNQEPNAGVDGISIYDLNGEQLQDKVRNVSPSLSSINIDFGPEMNAASFENAISFTSEDGAPVDFTYEIDDSDCIIKPNALLKGNTKYILTISPDVMSFSGKRLDNEFVMKFTTGDAAMSALLRGVKIDGNYVYAMPDLEAGKEMTIDTEFVNIANESAPLMWLVIYYNKNKAVMAQNMTAYVGPGSALHENPTFTLPDLMGITSVKVFLWNTQSDMAAYCDNITLE
ncbi:MAG: Ig-like domain-containing protein [Clostridiales bacterium]|nr:Ig-like domain-containing protein [Clostridiales bacterium]